MRRQLHRKMFAIVAVLVMVLAFVPATAARSNWTSSGSSAATGSSASVAGFVVYGDSLAPGWYDQSWDARVSYTYTNGVYTGRDAISYKATGAWAGLDIRSDTGVNGADYGQLTFALKASRNNQEYAVYLRDPSGQNLSNPVSLDNFGGQPVRNQWKTYSIPLSNLGASSSMIGHVVLHEWTGSSQPVVYVDQIELSGTGQGTTPVATPAPVVTPVTTPAPVVTPVTTPAPVVTPVTTPAPVVTPVPTTTPWWVPSTTPVPTTTPWWLPAATPVTTPVPTPVTTPVPTPVYHDRSRRP